MTNFDPKNLGPYIPFAAVNLKAIAYNIAFEAKNGRMMAWRECWHSDMYSDKEKQDIAKLIKWYRDLEIIITQHTWGVFREALVDGVLQLFAVNSDGEKKGIDAKFWASDYAPDVLSTGLINIPMYEPNGPVFCDWRDVSVIRRHVRALFFEMFRDIEKFKFWSPLHEQEMIADGRMGEINLNQLLAANSNSTSIAQNNRGRKPSFDVETFWTIVREIEEIGDININKRGGKKALVRKVRTLYIERHGSDDLPSDDTLIDRISDAKRDDEGSETIVIADR